LKEIAGKQARKMNETKKDFIHFMQRVCSAIGKARTQCAIIAQSRCSMHEFEVILNDHCVSRCHAMTHVTGSPSFRTFLRKVRSPYVH